MSYLPFFILCALMMVDVSATRILLSHNRRLAQLNSTQLNSTCAGSCSNILVSAKMYGALASSTVTNAGNTNVTGMVGVYPGSSVTGFYPGLATSIPTNADSRNTAAQSDAHIAYAYLKSLAHIANFTGPELGNLTLFAGVYYFAGGAHLSGNLTLDGLSQFSALFVFQSVSTFITEVGSRVILINGAQSCNVFFQVGSSATLAPSSFLKGSVVAYASIIVGHGTVVEGSLIATGAAVTLDDNIVVVALVCVDAATTPAPVVMPARRALTGLFGGSLFGR